MKKKLEEELQDIANMKVDDSEDITEDDEQTELDYEAVLNLIEEKEKENAELLDKYKRSLAEFDNFRKRTIKEKSARFDEGIMELALGLLPIVDNFERAISSTTESDKKTALYKGVELILKQMIDFMDSKDITVIEAKGAQFNPEIHAAVMHIDDPELGENEVVEDMQKGYMFKDKVLRHSVVKVAN